MDMQTIHDQATGVLPYVDSWSRNEVSFTNGVLNKFSDLFVDQVNLRLANSNSALRLEHEMFRRYLNTLLYNRVRIANSQGGTVRNDILKRLLIPSIYQLALEQIGVATDSNTGSVFHPVMDEPLDLLDKDGLDRQSDLLRVVRDFGFEANAGFKFEADGNLFFMTWVMVENRWYREDNQSPSGFGVLHSFFNIQHLDNVIRPRICYGLREYYDELLRGVIVDAARRNLR